MFVKKMAFAKKYDKVISLGVLVLTVIFVFILTRSFFLSFASNSMMIAGFIKFFFLASIGDFIGLRIKSGYYRVPKNIFFKAIVWGIIGSIIGLVFGFFSSTVATLQSKNILPFENVLFVTAFLTSLLMNLIFAPVMMSFHRITDTYLDGSDTITTAFKEVNWRQFRNIVLFKTIPFFWIPAHTITFLLPEEYRIIFAAILGIALGLLLSLFKK